MNTIIDGQNTEFIMFVMADDYKLLTAIKINIELQPFPEYYEVYENVIYHNSNTIFVSEESMVKIIDDSFVTDENIPSAFYFRLMKKMNETYNFTKLLNPTLDDLDIIITNIGYNFLDRINAMKKIYNINLKRDIKIKELNEKWYK